MPGPHSGPYVGSAVRTRRPTGSPPRGQVLIIRRRLPLVEGAQRPPGAEEDGVVDEPHRAVAQGDVDAAAVLAAGGGVGEGLVVGVLARRAVRAAARRAGGGVAGVAL